MPININGTTGISGADGSAATPAIQGADTNTGIFFPAADTVAVSTGGSERMRIDTSGNINIATAGARITGDFSNATVANRVSFQTSTANSATVIQALANGTGNASGLQLYPNTDGLNTPFLSLLQIPAETQFRSDKTGSGSHVPMTFYTGGSERMRIDTDGQQSSWCVNAMRPEYKCRAWVNFNGTGTVAIRASGNVSSITDNGTGNYTVNFTTAMPDANFCTQASCTVGSSTIEGIQTIQGSNTTSSCIVFTRNRSTGTAYDSSNVDVAIFR